MLNNRTWLAFANRKRCRHTEAIHCLGYINWRMGRARFSIGDIVYLFMSDKRCVRFKMVVTAENLEEYEGTMLSEKELCKYGLKGGRSLEIPNCNNKELIGYIKSIF